MVAIRTRALNFFNRNTAEKNAFKTSYKSYQIWRPADLKIQSRLTSLESDNSDVQYCCYVKQGAEEIG